MYSAKEIVDELKGSDKYLRKLMTDLSKSGFIKSVQGRDGGYMFTKEINQIFLVDVIDAIEGMDTLNGCVLGFDACSCANPCAMHHLWIEKRMNMNKLFRETSLSDPNLNNTLRF